MANVTRKQIVNALDNDVIINAIAAELDTTTDEVTATVRKMIASASRPRASKPSAETLKNRETIKLIVAEINARATELAAADIADFTTDCDGLPMNARKVGALCRQAANAGLIAVSPYPWSVKHYGPIGYEFAPKPERKAKKNAEKASEK
nr:MAG TPA: hypothetical protein [Caudoviricetes sp.]